MSELRTGRPSSANGGTTTTSKPWLAPSAATVSGVPRRSWPNAASGVIRSPARRVRAAIRPTKTSYSVVRERGVEVLDDDDLDAGRAEEPEPLLGVEQERRRGAQDTSSGWASNVMTAGRARCAVGLRSRWRSRYWWPRWMPSNTPMTAKIGPSSAAQPVDPARS